MIGAKLQVLTTAFLFLLASPLFSQQAAFTEQMYKNTYTETEKWFVLIMGPEPIASYDIYSSGLQSMLSKEAALRRMDIGKSDAGAIQYLEIFKITPYTTSDIVVAVDFAGRTENQSYICGYVVWEGVSQNDFKIARIEQNYVNAEAIAVGATEDVVKMMLEFRCPLTIIEAATGVSFAAKPEAKSGSD